ELIVDIVAHIRNQEESFRELRLQFDITGLVAVVGGKSHGVHVVGLVFQPDNELVSGDEFGNGMPIIFDALAGRDRRRGIAWSDIVTPIVGVIHAEVILDAAIEQRPNGLFAGEQLLHGVTALGGFRRTWESIEIVAGEEQRRIGVDRKS